VVLAEEALQRSTTPELLALACLRERFLPSPDQRGARRRGTITLSVPDDLAQVFKDASDQERKRLELILSLRLRELVERPRRSLTEVMDDIGRKAEERGLTEEVLESILREDGDG